MMKRPMIGRTSCLVLGLVLLASGASGTRPPGSSKCGSLELQWAGKKATGLLACVAKARGKGAPVDPKCLARVRAKFDAGWAKAVAAADCDTASGHDEMEAKVDDFVAMVYLAASPTFVTKLKGSNEVPPIVSTGTGDAIVKVDPVGHTLSVTANFSNLSAPTTAAHIHCCTPAGTNIGVATAVPTFPGFPLGVTSGSYTQTFDLTQASSYSATFVSSHGATPAGAEAALVSGLASGQAYFNIHTAMFPAGEIRGQL